MQRTQALKRPEVTDEPEPHRHIGRVGRRAGAGKSLSPRCSGLATRGSSRTTLPPPEETIPAPIYSPRTRTVNTLRSPSQGKTVERGDSVRRTPRAGRRNSQNPLSPTGLCYRVGFQHGATHGAARASDSVASRRSRQRVGPGWGCFWLPCSAGRKTMRMRRSAGQHHFLKKTFTNRLVPGGPELPRAR